MAEVKNNIFNNNIAGDTSNILVPDTSAIKNGIEFKSNINSNVLNGYYNLLSEAVQYLQFTGGLYDESADYGEGNIASLVIKNGTDYSIWQFRRNANNPQVSNNNPPITGASITTVNGVDAYEGGTLNTDWDKLTEDYAIEAAANTVMGRDSEGASNVNMPSSVTNTSIVNNEYLQQELQEGLAAKQDKLTAGTNITISEDNVISASGNLATKAALVSFDNTNTQLEQLVGYDFPKFKLPIADTNTINISYDRANITTTFNKVAENYIWQGDFGNVVFTNRKASITIDNINTTITGTGVAAFLLQFFNFTSIANNNNQFINLDENEIILEKGGVQTTSCKISLETDQTASNFIINIEPQGAEGDINGFMLVHFNIKNKILRLEETNLFYFNRELAISNLNITQNNSSVLVQGSFTSDITYNYTYFIIISSLVENYFNITVTNPASPESQLVNTTGITSSSGKAVKFGLYKLGDNQYSLFLAYQDGSQVQQGDVFTFNLTPDKNPTLNPIYQDPRNVQQAIEALADNIYDYSGVETIVLGEKVIDADGVEHQVYRKVIENRDYEFLGDNIQHSVYMTDNSINKNNYICVEKCNIFRTTISVEYTMNYTAFFGQTQDILTVLCDSKGINLTYRLERSNFFKGYKLIVKYYK